ncbi:Putative ParA-like ATPase involved in plasmid partitioning (modular protein) [Candidatus Methylobacter favarea]|uniref:ParA-like ATPase involved in plasmid partitioning (Modular protein) n=1 Tax=Candidatus Methylobacter favarea TaxID=2707345 RepID=A0A8S0XE51_9GAMM|nr:AAA family ATPase [Candidatus Methylobacter favarea]CAA9889452.1 Putative ParA-like ATPase involved in plasmid partitioning (modular protein) [Candidatus Methylobacter favarea]
MKTLVASNQKGGVGKTSTLVHLAFDFLERGMKIAVIDLDTQANASCTLQEFKSGYLAIQMFTADGDMQRVCFNDLSAEPVLCSITSDAAMANIEKLTMTEAATRFKSNIKVLDACGFDAGLIDTAPSPGVSMAAALFAADKVGGRKPSHGRHREAVKRACAQLMIPVGMGLRSSIADALASGVPVWKIKKSAEMAMVISIDNEPAMQNQAKNHLKKWADDERLFFCSDDALTALENTATDSVDIVASAYTLHNFQHAYRHKVIAEIFRILKPGGQFINGDRYGLDDMSMHTRLVQKEVSGYFKILIEANKLDLLESWIIHILHDESEDHIMRESLALNQLREMGFSQISLCHRMEVNALLTAIKPAQ